MSCNHDWRIIGNPKGWFRVCRSRCGASIKIKPMKEKDDLQLIAEAISLAKCADSEAGVLDAISVKEEVDWNKIPSQIQDEWNEAYGDAKKYLP